MDCVQERRIKKSRKMWTSFVIGINARKIDNSR